MMTNARYDSTVCVYVGNAHGSPPSNAPQSLRRTIAPSYGRKDHRHQAQTHSKSDTLLGDRKDMTPQPRRHRDAQEVG